MPYDIIKIRNTDDGIVLLPITLKARLHENKEQEYIIRIRMFSDYSYPWCFLAEKYLESLKYEMQIEYIGIEQHPNVPEEGKIIEPGSCLKNTIRRINHRGRAYGLVIPEVKIGPNTQKALLIGEYARSIGKEAAFTKAVMQACFMDGQNISDLSILERIA